MRGHEVCLLHSATEQEQRNRTPLIAVTLATLIALLCPWLFAAQTAAQEQSSGVRSQPTNGRTKAVVGTDEIKARIALSDVRAVSGQRVGVTVDFDITPGWHIYGKPLPEEYTSTTVAFDKDLVSAQNLDFPNATPVKFELLGETLPVYQGRFRAVGAILLRSRLVPGEHRLGGTLSFQECNDSLCKTPQQLRFVIPLRIESSLPSTPR
jgi:DsbC/DsbD-like thiol-disulfide interchange protein